MYTWTNLFTVTNKRWRSLRTLKQVGGECYFLSFLVTTKVGFFAFLYKG